jgi:hypothetical protein
MRYPIRPPTITIRPMTAPTTIPAIAPVLRPVEVELVDEGPVVPGVEELEVPAVADAELLAGAAWFA